MPTRLTVFAALTLLPSFAQNVVSTTTVGGSGTDSIRSMAVDASGNIWVVGTTSSADLPLLNPIQDTNKGTQVVISTDAGSTWQPVSSPQPNVTLSQPAIMAVDPLPRRVRSWWSMCTSPWPQAILLPRGAGLLPPLPAAVRGIA